MSAKVGSIYVSLTADLQQYGRAWGQAVSTTEQAGGRIQRAAGLTARSVTSLERSLSGSGAFRPGALLAAGRAFDSMGSRVSLLRGVMLAATGAFGGFTAALTTNVVARYADTYTNLTNQVTSVSSSVDQAKASINGIAGVADRSRSSLEATGLLFTRISKAAPDLDPTEVQRYVETIQKAMQLGGATAQEARSAAIQFSQAIASDRLGGEEFRAIMETPLGGELAKGLGVTIGKLREMSIAGELTANRVLGALSRISPEIDRKFGAMAVSLDQALTVADNKLILYVGEVDKSYGVTRRLGEAIMWFGGNLESIMPKLVALGAVAASVFTGRLLGQPLTGLTSRFSEELKERKALLEMAKEEAKLAEKKLVDASLARSRAAADTFGDQSKFASPSATAAYQRELENLRRLDDERTTLLERQRKVQLDIASTTASSTARITSLTQKLAASEGKVYTGLEMQKALRGELARAVEKESTAATMQTMGLGSQREVTAATKERMAIEKELSSVVRETDRARIVAEGRAQQISELRGAAEQAAATKRMGLLREEADIRQQLSTNYVMRQGVSEDATKAFGAAFRDGQARTTAAARATQIAFTEASTAFGVTTVNLDKMAEKTSVASVFFSGLRSGIASLVAFMGGPLGVAFTASFGLLTYLGIRSMEASQKVATAQKLIRDTLAAASTDSTSSTEVQSNAAAAWQARRDQIKATKDSITEIKDEVSRLNNEFANSAIIAISPLFRSDGSTAAITLRNTLVSLVAAVREGKMSLSEFDQKLTDIGVSGEIAAKLRTEIAKIKPEIAFGTQALAELEAKAKALDGTVINFKINVLGADAIYGVSATETPQLMKMYGPDAGLQEKITRFTDKIVGESKRSSDAIRIETKTWEIYNQAVADGMTRPEGGFTLDKARQLGAVVVANEKAVKESEASAKKAGAAYERMQQALQRLSEEARGSFLSEVDREVLSQMKKMKFSVDQMEAYRKAAENDNFTGIGKDAMKLREAFSIKAAAEAYRDLVKEYGTGAQVAPMFAQKQRELSYLVEQGKITAEQAQTAFGDYVASFRQYNWINDVSAAFTRFGENAIFESKNIGDAFRTLGKDIAKIALRIAFLNPFENWLKGTLGGLFGGGGGGGSAPINLLPFDDGGFTGHGGKHDPAGVVHKGEFVFDAEATRVIGVGNLEAMRRTARLPGFASGGFVSGGAIDVATNAVVASMAPGDRMSAVRRLAQDGAGRGGGDSYSFSVDARNMDAAAYRQLETRLNQLEKRLPRLVATATHRQKLGRPS